MLRLCIASFSILLVSTAAFAVEPNAAPAPATTPLQSKVVAIVNKAFVTPYDAKQGQRTHYSRMPVRATEHRVRVTDEVAQVDATGAKFVRFSIDQRYGYDDGEWTKDAMTGCAYVDTSAVFVKNGSKLRPAAAYLGKKAGDAPDTACVVIERTASR